MATRTQPDNQHGNRTRKISVVVEEELIGFDGSFHLKLTERHDHPFMSHWVLGRNRSGRFSARRGRASMNTIR